MKNPLCKSPLKIGLIYRDPWGRPNRILGQDKRPFTNTPVDGVVRSLNGRFYQKTGNGFGTTLINLSRKEELSYFKKQWEIIHKNPVDKLRFVKTELEELKSYIERLEDPRWKRENES